MDHRKRPLSYLGQQAVIPYINAQTRIVLASRIASIAKLHKAAPIRIDTLKLEKSSYTVDDFKYSFGSIVQSSNDDPLRNDIILSNLNGGFSHDVNCYGSEESSPAVLGDIKPAPDFGRHFLEVLNRSVRTLLRETQSPHHTFYVRGSVKWNNIVETARSPDGFKLTDCIRNSIETLTGKNCVCRVNHLHIDCPEGVIRLPEGLKFLIHNLSLKSNSTSIINAFKPIILENSFPLQSVSVEIHSREDLNVLNADIVRTAETVILSCVRNLENLSRQEKTAICSPFKNIVIYGKEFPIAVLRHLIQRWRRAAKRVGSKFSMQSEFVEHDMKTLKKEFNANELIKDPTSSDYSIMKSILVLSINKESELHIYSTDFPDSMDNALRNEVSLMIVIEVVPIKTQ